MDDQQDVAALEQRIAALEAEIARLKPIEAAAREAHAFFAGRRPGFAFSYPQDVLQAVFAPDAARKKRNPKRGATATRRKTRL